MANPKISIYMPTCDRPQKLSRAVDSVLHQSYNDWELIICDDASGEETKDTINSITKLDARIRCITNLTRSGACVTRNLGINSARGHFITGLDDDDEYSPNRLELLLSEFRDDFIFVCDDFLNVYKNGKKKRNFGGGARIFTLQDLLRKNEASNQIFTKTTTLQSINGFDYRVKRLQDWDTWVRVCSTIKNSKFLRLDFASYLMHHDHKSGEKRVSSSYSTAQAFSDFILRHRALMDEKTISDLNYYVRSSEGIYGLHDMLKDLYNEPRLKPFGRYIRSILLTRQ